MLHGLNWIGIIVSACLFCGLPLGHITLRFIFRAKQKNRWHI